VGRDQCANAGGRKAARTRDARELVLRRGRRDMRVEAAAEAVTRSIGTGCALPGSAAWSAAMRALAAEASAGLVAAKLVPVEAAPL